MDSKQSSKLWLKRKKRSERNGPQIWGSRCWNTKEMVRRVNVKPSRKLTAPQGLIAGNIPNCKGNACFLTQLFRVHMIHYTSLNIQLETGLCLLSRMNEPRFKSCPLSMQALPSLSLPLPEYVPPKIKYSLFNLPSSLLFWTLES